MWAKSSNGTGLSLRTCMPPRRERAQASEPAERSGEAKRGPRERRRWGVRGGEAPRRNSERSDVLATDSRRCGRNRRTGRVYLCGRVCRHGANERKRVSRRSGAGRRSGVPASDAVGGFAGARPPEGILNGPMFSRPMRVDVGEIVERDGFIFADVYAATARTSASE